ncbi:MAG: hypothetical protein C0616_08690 [Desulfuromonas sp.]|nr:MAG: hypothetical protein C0616_08690 [Desulfuromonas sp.]
MKPIQITLLLFGLAFLGFLMFQQTPSQTMSESHITQESAKTQPKQGAAVKNGPDVELTAVQEKLAGGQREGALFVNAIDPIVVELPGDAVPYWQAVADESPLPLIVLSLHPLLQPIPESAEKRALNLARNGTPEDFQKLGRFSNSDPVLLPIQSVRVTVDSGMFKRLGWVFPTRSPIEDIDPNTFRQQMKTLGFLSVENAAALKYTSGIFNGKISGYDFSVYHPGAIGHQPDPVIVHFDLSYFKGIYKNPVSTPIYGLLHQTASAIRAAGWNVKLVTLSFSTENQAVSLEVRFLMAALAEMVRNPDLLETGLPPAWEKRAQAMYAGAMYMESDAKKLIRAAAESYPDDAAALYDMAMLSLQQGDNQGGIDFLDEAVRLDSGYASAYPMLASRSAETGNFQQALEFGQKAKSFFPDNAFIDIGMVESLVALERFPEAREKLIMLEKLDWSTEYHPDVPDYLRNLQKVIETANQTPSEKNDLTR